MAASGGLCRQGEARLFRYEVIAFGIGWAVVLAIGQGWVAHDSRLGWVPMFLFGATTMVCVEGFTDAEQRARLFLLSAASFASCLIYAVFRYFLLLGFAGR